MGTVTTRSNIFQRIFQGVVGVIIGIVLIIGMFVLAIWSETRENPANIAKNAKEVTISKADDAADYNGEFVAFAGKVMAEGTLADDGLKTPDDYAYLYRFESVYAYIQESSTSTSTSLGGNETTTTVYTYKLAWTTDVETDFSNDTGADTDGKRALATTENGKIIAAGINPQATRKYNSRITVGGVTLSTTDITFNEADEIVPSATIITDDYTFSSSDNYIYKRKTAGTDTVGDFRVGYMAIKSGTNGIAIGKLNGTTLEVFTSKRDTKMLRFVAGVSSKSALVNYLNKENSDRLLIFRIIVIIGMILGFILITAPLTIILSIIPFLGRAGKAVQYFVSAILGLLFGIIAIVIGLLARFWFITVPVLALLLILLIVLSIRKKKKQPA